MWTGPVYDDNTFYGRRDEAQDLARQLQQGQIRACLGVRKIGKTSIMNRVLYVAQDYHTCSNIVIDCSKEGVFSGSAAGLLNAIALGVEAAASDEDFHSEVLQCVEGSTITEAYQRLVTAVRATPFPVVIFFDEVDYITPSSPTAAAVWEREFNPFWRNLRAVYQELKRTESIFSVFVSGVSSKWFREGTIGGVENAALAFVPEEYLSPLHTGAANAMIIDIARTAGLIFDEEIAHTISSACSNIPFWMRKAGSYIHRNTPIDARPFQPGKGVIAAQVHAFVETEGAAIAEVALSHLFKVYPELESVATACFEERGKDEPPHLLNVLERYGVITGRDRGRKMSGHMMKEGMRAYLAKRESIPVNGTPSGRMRFESVDEWAEELAALSASRNKLERRLRGIVLNFVRYDELHNPTRSLQDRLIKCVQPQRRSALQHLSADDLIEKLLWTELTALIEREWGLFQQIFADRQLFRQNATVINYRYDAHAKNVDRADVAEYRRALQWFEDKLAKV